MTYIFTSESVSEGHPDKICDQVSDAVLDAALEQDPSSRTAIETFTTTGLIIVGGEVTTKAQLDIQKIVRNTVREIGYTNAEYGLDANSCCVMSLIHEQSADISLGVNKGTGTDKEMGAGDQGMMFGYACKQTPELMPMPISLAHKLVKGLSELRKSKTLPYLRPDSKAQVTMEYQHSIPKTVHTIVVSTQHDPDVDLETITKDIKEKLIPSVVAEKYLSSKTRYLINPTGRFVIGGPHGDTGLTGRKIIVDTYGGWGAHGGGAFSGKDCTKVDRSAAYMARYIAKNMVAADLADDIEIQLSYAIGISQPISILVNAKNSKLSNLQLEELIKDNFDLTPEGIINSLDLRRPIFRKTAAYGHFGRENRDFTWENTDKAETLKRYADNKYVLSKC
ncbi:methionine adenosyltransferase [Candidatus Margulisiibacteriota bacterium]